MAAAHDNYKFPDEQENSRTVGEDDIEIEIVDDTPEADKNRAPMPREIIDELEKDDLEEYSEKVKTRLAQMKKVWHDERREKEAASREKDEALRFAQSAYQENKQLKQRLGDGERLFAEEAAKSAAVELAVAKEQLRQAYDSGDGSSIADAQEVMTDAKLKLRDVQAFKPSLHNEQNDVQPQIEQAQVRQQVDPKAESWRGKNTWFGADEEMTALALGLHEKLVRSGVDPRSDDYYQRVDETMRKRFPENFTDEQTQTQGQTKTAPRKAANVVAPATRSTAPKQVRLSASQVAIAKRLGLTNEAYAKEMIKLENYNG